MRRHIINVKTNLVAFSHKRLFKKIDTVNAPPDLAFASSLCFGVMKVSSVAVIETFSDTSGMFGAYESPVGASTTTSSGSVARGIQKIPLAQAIVEGLCQHLIA